MDRLQVANASLGHVEGMRSLDAQLVANLHRRRRLEVLARNGAADDEVDVVERGLVLGQATLRGARGVVGDACVESRLQVANLGAAQRKHLLDPGLDGSPLIGWP